jgi:hypothetical protein
MAKYHDRHKERSKHRTHSMSDGAYAGSEPRRRQEMEDAGMIREDHSAIANLPQEVMMKRYENPYSYIPETLDDTIRGADRQIGLDDDKRRNHTVPKKI